MLTKIEHFQKLHSFLQYSPYIKNIENETTNSFICHFDGLLNSLRLRIEEDGMVWLTNTDSESYVRLALGPTEDHRLVSKSLEYFLNGLLTEDHSNIYFNA